MAETAVHFLMDEDLKQDLEQFCTDVGMNLSTGYDPFYSVENQNRLKKSIEQMEATGGTVYKVNWDDESIV